MFTKDKLRYYCYGYILHVIAEGLKGVVHF